VSAKDLINMGLGRLGVSVTRFPPPHFVSHQLRNLILMNEITVVLDVGAFHGSYCNILRKEVGYRGLIVSFEPCAQSFQALSAQMAGDRNWRGYQFGLSDTDSTAVLNTYGARGDFNSVLHLREEDAGRYNVDIGHATTEAIRLFKVDTIWSEITNGISSPRVFLKMDTQGHDTAVVLGAAKHLEYIHGIQSEMSAIQIYHGMTPMPEALSLYEKLGFVPVGFYPVNTPKSYGASPEFDVLLKRFSRS
jgi:FkbM family methyltransferase